MSQPESKPINHLGLKLIAATLLATALVFAWTSSNYKSDQSTKETWIDQTGHLHVLGITLGRTVLREAEIALKSRSDIALYIYPESHSEAGLTLEAFFPAIADHSKVILKLDADESLLKKMQQRSTLPHLYPNKVARMNLHPEDLPAVQQLPVKTLTLIPSIEITIDKLKARFGEPSSTHSSDDGSHYYLFADVGLQAMLKQGDATRLLFRNP